MPLVADSYGLALSAFLDETAPPIAADCPLIEGEDAQVDAVKAKVSERVSQYREGDVLSEPATEERAVEDTDGVSSAAVMLVETMEASRADESFVPVDCPMKRVAVGRDVVVPGVCRFFGQFDGRQTR